MGSDFGSPPDQAPATYWNAHQAKQGSPVGAPAVPDLDVFWITSDPLYLLVSAREDDQGWTLLWPTTIHVGPTADCTFKLN